MGRGKIEIKKIDNPTNRQVTFSKRRSGLLKKAKELSVLCSAQVAIVIFSSTGKLSVHPESSTELRQIIERYQLVAGRFQREDPNTPFEINSLHAENERLQTTLRHMMGEDLAWLSLDDLGILEEHLNAAISRVRSRRDQVLHQVIHRDRQSSTRILEMEGENELLRQRIENLEQTLDNCRTGPLFDYLDDRAFGQDEPHHFNLIPPTPTILRLQPNQINLQEAEQYLQSELRLGFGCVDQNLATFAKQK